METYLQANIYEPGGDTSAIRQGPRRFAVGMVKILSGQNPFTFQTQDYELSLAARNRHQAARMLPMMEWKLAEMADGTGASAICGKVLRASTAPRPEFCIPTSMETVRQDSSGSLKIRAMR
jgi:hypothetical protein